MEEKEHYIEQVFEQEQQRLTGFVKRRVGSLEDAEDIVQDVFVSLTSGFDDISDLRKSISWLYTVAKNRIVDFLRKKKTYSVEDQKKAVGEDGESLSMLDLIPSLEELPDSQMMQDLIWQQIQLSLNQLPKEQRDVFVWHELEGKSFAIISEITGISVNTLLSRKRYAVVFLREELKDLFEIIKA